MQNREYCRPDPDCFLDGPLVEERLEVQINNGHGILRLGYFDGQ